MADLLFPRLPAPSSHESSILLHGYYTHHP